jgi:hypothetical protein
VGSRYCHDAVIANEPGQRECAMKDANSAIDSPAVFGIVRPQRAGDHDRVSVAHSDWLVSNLNDYSVGSKVRQRLRLRAIGSGDDKTLRAKHACNAAHSASTDSDEMNTAELCGYINGQVGRNHDSTLSP